MAMKLGSWAHHSLSNDDHDLFNSKAKFGLPCVEMGKNCSKVNTIYVNDLSDIFMLYNNFDPWRLPVPTPFTYMTIILNQLQYRIENPS